MATRYVRERLSRRPVRAPDRSAGYSVRHQFRRLVVCGSHDRVLSRPRGQARLWHVRARRGAAVLPARRTSATLSEVIDRHVIARSDSDEAIHSAESEKMDCFASLAMTD